MINSIDINRDICKLNFNIILVIDTWLLHKLYSIPKSFPFISVFALS